MGFTRRKTAAGIATPQEIMFVAEYLSNGHNATQVYAKVYKNTNLTSACTLGGRILDRPHVQKEIERQAKLYSNRCVYNKGKIMQNLNMIADSNIADYIYVVEGKTYIKSLSCAEEMHIFRE